MARRLIQRLPASAVITALLACSCSFQSFDYLKGAYKSAVGGSGGAGGAQAAAGAAGGGGADVAASGAENAAGSPDFAGNSGSGGDDPIMGDGGDGGAAPVPPGMLLNPGFELGSETTIPGWTSVGDTAAATVVFANVHRGSGRLGHWLQTGAYKVSTSQIVKPLPDGMYSFKIWVRHSLFLNAEYIFARGYSLAEPAAQKKVNTTDANDSPTFTQIEILHIPVTSGKCEVGIYTDGGADQSTNWSGIDDAELTLEPEP